MDASSKISVPYQRTQFAGQIPQSTTLTFSTSMVFIDSFNMYFFE